MKQVILNPTYQPLHNTLLDQHQTVSQRGQTAFYVLPTAGLLEYARDKMAHRHQVTASLGRDFLAFDDMVALILQRGRSQLKPLDAIGQRVIITCILKNLAKEEKLLFLQDLAHYPGVVHRVLSLIGELKRANIRKFVVSKDLHKDTEGQRRDQDVALIYQKYQQFLHEHQLRDIEEGYFRAIDICRNQPQLLQDVGQIIVDGFVDFTPLQLALLESLTTIVPTTHITLPFDQKRPLLFNNVCDTITKLEQQDFARVESRQTTTPTFTTRLFDISAVPEQDALTVEVWQCWSLQQELKEVARKIKTLVLHDKVPLAEIALVVPDADTYQEVIREVFSKAHIPIEQRERTCLRETLVVQHLLSLLRVVNEDWSQQTLLVLLNSWLFSWPAEVDKTALLALVRKTSHTGDLLSWQKACERQYNYWQGVLAYEEDDFGRNQHQEARTNLEQLTLAQEALTHLSVMWQKAFPPQGTFTQMAKGLRELCDSLQIATNIAKQFGKYPLATVAKWYSAWHEVDKVIQELASLYCLWADNEMMVSEFAFVLESALSTIELPHGRPTQRGLKLYTPSSIRGLCFQHLFIVGCNDGSFPSRPAQDWFYGERERELLMRQGIEIQGPLYAQQQERLFFYLSTLTATKTLYLSYRVHDGQGKEAFISPFVEEVQRIAFCTKRFWNPNNMLPRQGEMGITTTEEMQIKAFHSPGLLPSYLQRLIDIEQQRMQGIYGRYNGLLKDKQVVAEMEDRYGAGRTFSSTAFAQYGRCPFAFYLQRVLRLQPLAMLEEGITPLSRGSVLHQVLASFLLDHLGNTLKTNCITQYQNKLEQLLSLKLEAVKQQLTLTGEIITGLEQNRLLRTLWRWLDAEIAYQAKVTLRPVLIEHRFKGDEAVILGDEEDPLIIEGFIDRVDADGSHYVVYDYKTGQPPNLKEVHAGVEFQMPVYLLAAERLFDDDKCAIGAGYYELKGKYRRNRGMWHGDYLKLAHVSSKNDVVAAEEWKPLLQQVVERLLSYRQAMRQGYFVLAPNDASKTCKYCDYKHICRLTPELALRVGEGEIHATNT